MSKKPTATWRPIADGLPDLDRMSTVAPPPTDGCHHPRLNFAHDVRYDKAGAVYYRVSAACLACRRRAVLGILPTDKNGTRSNFKIEWREPT